MLPDNYYWIKMSLFLLSGPSDGDSYVPDQDYARDTSDEYHVSDVHEQPGVISGHFGLL